MYFEVIIMHLTISKSANAVSYYVSETVTKDGKKTTAVIEKLGTDKQIRRKYKVDDAESWARAYIKKLNNAKKAKDNKIMLSFSTDVRIDTGVQCSYNIGYFFLQRLYHQLGLPTVCKNISKNYDFTYDLNSILSRLIYGRILYPSSKLSCFEQSTKLYEQPNFELQHVYRALDVLAKESDSIQAALYKNSKRIIKRKTGVLYYDCTNYFFDIDSDDGLKQYGPSKEHRPNPIVQMGLFMDMSGIPLAFCINPGNQNEQLSLKPLEQQIMKDFELSKFIVCTDAGLSSEANRKFNNFGERSFITTQSIRNLNRNLREWCLDPAGWSLAGSRKKYDISTLEDNKENRKLTFYKQKLIEGYDEERDIEFNQTLIVTYSLKYKDYQENIRANQIRRAENAIKSGKSKIEKNGQNDYKRFIHKTAVTSDGEVAEKRVYELDLDAVAEESRYDGFYAVCTNLDDDPADIAKINHDRWEIEESFRIMKSEFKARPVYLQNDNRITAHFLTCFISLLIYRLLEKKLDNRYTCEEIINTLKDMNLTKAGAQGYIPAYTRTAITDELHESFGFNTDFQYMTERNLKGIARKSKGL
jgi:transposase